MAFQPDELQLAILQALEQLELHGCSSATKLGEECPPRITFEIGVPGIILRAWSDAGDRAFDDAMRHLKRRALVKEKRLGGWPLPSSGWRIRTSAGRVIWLRCTRMAVGEAIAHLAKLTGRRIECERATKRTKARRSPKQPSLPAVVVEARVEEQRGAKLEEVRLVPYWSFDGMIPYYSISRRGLACLDRASSELDELVRLSQVAPLTGRSERTLQRYIKKGVLPAPDVPGGGGKPNLWYWKTLRPKVEEISGRSMPTRFPGSRII